MSNIKFVIVVIALLLMIYPKSGAIELIGNNPISTDSLKIGNRIETAESYDIPSSGFTIVKLEQVTVADTIQSANQTHIAREDTMANDIHIKESDFFYADNPRYTLTGELPLKNTKIRPLPFSIFAGTTATFIAVQHIWQVKTIWDSTTHFRFIEDGGYAQYVDKMGHVYGSYIMATHVKEGLYLSGFGKESAAIWAAVVGLGYSTYVEIMDGFGTNWGFSPTDWYCDVTGAVFFLAQQYVPFLQNFTPKFSYFPGEWYGYHPRKEAKIFIDDYSGQNFSISINVHNLLPEKAKAFWPDWLELNVGYAARNLSTSSFDYNSGDIYKHPYYLDGIKYYAWADRKLIVSLDYNLVKLLPNGSPFWNWFRQSINYFKLPSPAIEYGLDDKKVKFFILYPFPIF